MKAFIGRLTAALCIVALGACASAPRQDAAVQAPPAPFAVVDPPDHALEQAVRGYIRDRDAPPPSQFEFTRVDLNGDGRRDGLVMMTAPYTTWCSMDGCLLLVFGASDSGFAPVAEIGPVRGPLKVAQTRTAGWRDLIVRVSGRQYLQSKDVAMKFNGTAYPPYPAFEPPLQYASASVEGVEVFP